MRSDRSVKKRQDSVLGVLPLFAKYVAGPPFYVKGRPIGLEKKRYSIGRMRISVTSVSSRDSRSMSVFSSTSP